MVQPIGGDGEGEEEGIMVRGAGNWSGQDGEVEYGLRRLAEGDDDIDDDLNEDGEGDGDGDDDEAMPTEYHISTSRLKEILPDGSKYVSVPAVAKENCPSAQEMNAKLAEVGDGAEFKEVPSSDLAYVLSESWLGKLSHFLTTEDLDFHPGPVDNSDLFEENMLRENHNLSKRGDYKLLSKEQWELLIGWFGGKR